MARRRSPLLPPRHALPASPPAQVRHVVLRWLRPPGEVYPADVLHAAERALDRLVEVHHRTPVVLWWASDPARVACQATRAQAVLAALLPVLGAPTTADPSRRSPEATRNRPAPVPTGAA